MIHLTRKAVRRWLDVLLHIEDTPERTAAAFALGVFFGFSPFLGFHTILAIIFAFFLNLNRVAWEDSGGARGKVTTRADGVLQIYFHDPDGYKIEVNQAAKPGKR